MTEPHAYCTYFDSGYLARGLTLIESLRAHGDESDVWIMTLDEAAHVYLEQAALPGVKLLTLAELEAAVPGLAQLKSQRSRMEYVFTMTPLLIREVMQRYSEPTAVAYLDADLYYFDDPQLVFDAMGAGSVGIIEHRYPQRLERKLAKYGRFNVGWVGFRADDRGRACLDWWGESTMAWCRDVPEDGKYADQGYLDSFPELFEGVSILPSAGLDLAPWNTARHTVEGPPLTADGDPLVFFHFHGIKRTASWWITAQLLYGAPLSATVRERVYEPYVRRLEHHTRVVESSPLIPHTGVAPRGAGLRGMLFAAQRKALNVLSIVSGNAIRAR